MVRNTPQVARRRKQLGKARTRVVRPGGTFCHRGSTGGGMGGGDMGSAALPPPLPRRRLRRAPTPLPNLTHLRPIIWFVAGFRIRILVKRRGTFLPDTQLLRNRLLARLTRPQRHEVWLIRWKASSRQLYPAVVLECQAEARFLVFFHTARSTSMAVVSQRQFSTFDGIAPERVIAHAETTTRTMILANARLDHLRVEHEHECVLEGYGWLAPSRLVGASSRAAPVFVMMGSGCGIGSRAVEQRGWGTFAVDRSKSRLEHHASNIAQRRGHAKHATFACDVSNVAQRQGLRTKLGESGVNCAVITSECRGFSQRNVVRMVSNGASRSRALLLMMICSVIDLVDYLLVRRIGQRSLKIDVHTHTLSPPFCCCVCESIDRTGRRLRAIQKTLRGRDQPAEAGRILGRLSCAQWASPWVELLSAASVRPSLAPKAAPHASIPKGW